MEKVKGTKPATRNDVARVVTRMDRRFDKLDGRMGGLEDRMGGVEDRMGGVEGQMGGLQGRMGTVETTLKRLAADTVNTKVEVQGLKELVLKLFNGLLR